MNYKEFLFSKEGRANRKALWVDFYLKIALPIMVAGLLLDMIFEMDKFIILSQFIILIPSVTIQVKRAHDRNRPGYFLLLSLIPLVNLWVIVEIFFLKGTSGVNNYGEDPLVSAVSN